jgi:hypothetical protein
MDFDDLSDLEEDSNDDASGDELGFHSSGSEVESEEEDMTVLLLSSPLIIPIGKKIILANAAFF